ncbi:MAG TPA: glycosyltransferase family 4 protein [Pseudolysinimonas sp.]|jgi:glycosyltransferase involved in cell wall biosynthesis|nr:glycosyltransferase family 4 protein [Pseudolysinimonas sp.]
MTRVLILTGDPIGERMAGPAIRSWNLGLALRASGHDVRLVTTTRAGRDGPFPIFAVSPDDDAGFRVHERWAEVIVFQGHGMSQFPSLRRSNRYLVADIYDPMHLEMLEQGRELPRATWDLRVVQARDALNDQLRRADFMVCASERQRLFFLGHLAALGRISPATYDGDPDLRRLIDLAPFGLDAEPPTPGAGPRTDPDERILIWGGGVYSWFDPLTLIRAVAAVASRRPHMKLFFLGTRHPAVDEMGIVRQAFELARELGVEGTSVVFNDTWVPYDDRGAYLLDADAGVSTHHVHIETTFAFRTRILDYLWAGLPMIVTEGDSFAELVRDESLGVVVQAENVPALEAAIETVLYDREAAAAFAANVARVRERFEWHRALAAVLAFADSPHHAADYRGDRDAMGVLRTARRTAGPAHDVRMTWHHLRASGLRDVVGRVARRLRRP